MRKKKLLALTLFAGAALSLASCVKQAKNPTVTPTKTDVTPTTTVTDTGSNPTTTQTVEPTTGVTPTSTVTPTTPTSAGDPTTPTSTVVPTSTIDIHTNDKDAVEIISYKGDQENLYACFYPVKDATDYSVYVNESGSQTIKKVDSELLRLYKNTNNEFYYRVDALGLKAGSYDITIKPVINGTDNDTLSSSVKNIDVISYDRSGFAFSSSSPLGSSNGAYNADGTLKSNAQVIYVTSTNAKTVKATLGGNEYTGLQTILDAYQKGYSDALDIRIIGKLSKDDLDHISSSAEGLQIKGKNNYQNINLTIEGVGSDATIHGFGILLRNTANVEIRNLGVLWFMDDGISVDTNNSNIWIHDIDISYGQPGSSADQVKGDGSIDIKADSKYVTVSYVHFIDSGKCSLCGMKSESSTSYVTYHHNWFNHSDSRHPRPRTMSIHVYNNYFDGNSKYGIGGAMGSNVLSENNYFRNVAHPYLSSMQGTDALGDGTFSGEDGGMIKAVGDKIVGGGTVIYANSGSNASETSFDAYLATSRNENVPSIYKTKQGGTNYNHFESQVDLGIDEADLDTPDEAVNNVTAYAGRVDGGDFKWTFNNSTDDADYGVNEALKTAIKNYTLSSLISTFAGDSSQGGTTPIDPTDPVTPTTTGSTTPTTTTTGNNITTTIAADAIYRIFDNDDSKLTNYVDSTGLTKITGNLKSNASTIVFNGRTYTTALKMESGTSINLILDGTYKITLLTDTASKKINVAGVSTKTDSNGLLVVTLNANTEITKGDTMNLYAIIFEKQ